MHATEDISRFWSKVDRSGGQDACWPWMLGKNRDGYGKFKIKGRTRLAHAISFEITNGVSVAGKPTLHRCDNPCCCNPAHLFAGTNADNMADKTAKGRQSKLEKHGRAKLTAEQVRSARSRYRPRDSMDGIAAMAREFGVSYAAMHFAVSGRNWSGIQ